jgi:hypothetical protein
VKKKQYEGRRIRLTYPELLTVKTADPEWSAFARKGTGAIVILLDPAPQAAKAFSRLIRNPYYTRVPGTCIVREGPFATPNGLEGHERVAEMTETMGWFLDGTFSSGQVVNIQIWSIKSEWHDGKMWKELVDSIEIVESNGNGN